MESSPPVTTIATLQSELAHLRPLPADAVARLRAVFAVDELTAIYQSNAMEGNTLTLRETELVVAHGITVGGKPLKDHLEAINLAAALTQVKALVQDQTPLSDGVLLTLHRMVLTRIDDANAGRYRSDPVRILGAGHVPPNPQRVPALMEAFWHVYDAARLTGHPVLVAADVHERITTIHPFIDGNGRTARLAMNLHLLQHGYPLLSIPPERDSRLAYYEALDATAAGRDPQAFRLFLARRMHATLTRYLQILREEVQDAVPERPDEDPPPSPAV